jgi:dTDP-4-dehydrorhamnose reductase
VNRDGAAALAAAAAALGAPVLHVSTDYVFDGTKGVPYTEADAPAPAGAYGRSKLEGERAVLAANPRSVVLRTSWVVSATGHNFLRTMLRLAETRDEVAVVDDQRGAPTFAADLAEAVLGMAPRLAAAPAGDAAFGVFHLAGAPDTTWHGFAAAIFAAAAARGRRVPALRAIPTSAYPTPTRRPADSRLDCSRIAAVHGVGRPDSRPALERCLDGLLGPARGAPVGPVAAAFECGRLGPGGLMGSEAVQRDPTAPAGRFAFDTTPGERDAPCATCRPWLIPSRPAPRGGRHPTSCWPWHHALMSAFKT